MKGIEVPKIPDRLFFRIGDVADLAGVEPYVLRFWETEFSRLSPRKTSSGQRQYRRKDVELVLEIKRLLYDEGYTIAGARKALRDRSKQKRRSIRSIQTRGQSKLPFAPQSETAPLALSGIRQELNDILALLAKY
jgi:DNA-binding transcriptional MerR regulator